MLAMKHGMGPQSAEEMYELCRFYDKQVDRPKEEYKASIFRANTPAEQTDKFVEVNIKIMNNMEARWADGRAHACGANLTAADFSFLAFYAFISHPNLRNPVIGERLMALFNTLPNLQRVL